MRLTKENAEKILLFLQTNGIMIIDIDKSEDFNLNDCQLDDEDFVRLLSENEI